MNKGSFGELSGHNDNISEEQKIINAKIDMARDLGVSIRLKSFKDEISKDAQVGLLSPILVPTLVLSIVTMTIFILRFFCHDCDVVRWYR